MKTFKRGLDIFVTALLALLLAVNLANIIAVYYFKDPLPHVFGIAHAIVGSGSMEPALSVNDLIFVKECDSYSAGDIITYVDENDELVTHRITGKTKAGFVTQGDANNIRDAVSVTDSMIQGKVVLVIPKIGSAIRFLGSRNGIFLLIILAGIMIELQYRKDTKSKNKKEGGADDECGEQKAETGSGAKAEAKTGSGTKAEAKTGSGAKAEAKHGSGAKAEAKTGNSTKPKQKSGSSVSEKSKRSSGTSGTKQAKTQ